MRRALPLVLVGCNQIYGLEETRLPPPPPDAPPPPGCSGGTFGNPVALDTFEGAEREFEAALRHDLREVWFMRVAARDEIWFATRASVDAPFDPPALAPFSAAGSTDDGRPSITGDGLRVLFTSDRGGGNDLWEVSRPALDAGFGAPKLVAGLGGANVLSFDISHDGKRLYFTDSNAVDDALYVAWRPSLDEPFGPPSLVIADAPFPAISPDELEVFFNPPGTSAVWRHVRRSTADPFVGPAQVIFDSGDDPDLAGDGRTLVLARSSSLVLFERDCP